MKLIFALLILILGNCKLTKNHTVIGIYTQTLDSYKGNAENYSEVAIITHNNSFISAAYVKYI